MCNFFLQIWQKCHLSFPIKILRKKSFFEKEDFFNHFRTLSLKCLDLHQKVCKTCILAVQRNILKKCFFYENFFSSSCPWAKNTGLLSKKFSKAVKTAFYVSKGIFWWKHFLSPEKNYFLQRILTLSARFLVGLQNFFGNVVKTAFSVSIGSILGKISRLNFCSFFSFPDFVRKVSCLSSKLFWLDCQNLHSSCPEDSFEDFFFGKFFSVVIGQWAKSYRPFLGKF